MKGGGKIILTKVRCLNCSHLVRLRTPKIIARSPHALLPYLLDKKCSSCGFQLSFERLEEFVESLKIHRQFSLEEMRLQQEIIMEYMTLLQIIDRWLIEKISRYV